MPTLIRERRPTARRAHRCQTCQAIIHPGQTYDRATLVYDGRIYDWVTCPPCTSLITIVHDWSAAAYDEGVGESEYDEWARDIATDLSDPNWAAAVDYLARRSYAPRGDTL